MILFVSDIHFGRHDFARERAKEADLIAFLQAHEDDVEHLFLVGDVFDQYIEYHHLVPKGFIRFQALLAAWTDRGVPVTYLVGNHDPWHQDYFAKELGVRIVHDHLTEPLYGRNVHMTHGDGIGAPARLYSRLKPWLRHPIPVSMYRTLLPGDAGFRLARWVCRRIGRDVIDPESVDALQAHAYRLLHASSADVVVMGHTHQAVLRSWPVGQYLNTGCWHDMRTFGRLDKDGLKLLHWNGTCTQEVKP